MPWIVVQTETRSTTKKVKGRQNFGAEVSTTNWWYHSFLSLFFWIFITGPNYNSKVLNSWSEQDARSIHLLDLTELASRIEWWPTWNAWKGSQMNPQKTNYFLWFNWMPVKSHYFIISAIKSTLVMPLNQ